MNKEVPEVHRVARNAFCKLEHTLPFLLTSRSQEHKIFVGEGKIQSSLCPQEKNVILYLEMWFNGAYELNYYYRINVEKYEYFIVEREGKIRNYYFLLYIIYQSPL
jgi:hypothetical protein